MKPSVGRVVHYVAHGTPIRPDGTQAFPSVCRAAMVTEVDDDPNLIGLCAINPSGLFFHPIANGGCTYDDSEKPAGGSWHWPERVD